MRDLDFSIMLQFIPLIGDAILIVLQIGIFSFIFASLIAVVVGVLRAGNLPKPFQFILSFYVEFVRGTPLLVQLFVFYYGLPAFGIKVPPIQSAIITMSLNSGAYFSEFVRASVLSVDKGQYEAAKTLGYSKLQTSLFIVLPQAMRIAIPSFMNGFSTMIKETSMVSVLPVVELLRLGNQIYAITFRPFEIYLTLAVIYFCLTYPMTFLAKWLERRLSQWVA